MRRGKVLWLFFDIGSTLVDEQAAYDHRIRDMIAGTDLTFEEVHAKRIELALQGLDGNSAIIKFFGLVKTPWHSEDETLYADADGVIRHLKSRGYMLGIIANQAPGAEERLKNWGIADCLSVIASSSALGVSKPDTRIFEKALAMAGCSASQAVMIGDRLDNDIIPAKQCGLQTVWFRSGLAAYQPKELGEGYADYVIDDLLELKELWL